MNESLAKLLSLPGEFSALILGFTFLLAVSPYFSGYDFGILKIPKLPIALSRRMRYLGPGLFFLVVVAHLPIWSGLKTPPRNAVAVLGFDDLSSDQALGPFIQGFTNELMHAIASEKALRIVSKTSSLAFKTHSEAPHLLRERLNVKMFLEGSVNKTGERLRIDVRLVATKDNFVLWIKSYDATHHNASSVYETIAQKILADVKAAMGLVQPSQLSATLNPSHSRVILAVFFETGTEILRPEARQSLGPLVAALKSSQASGFRILIEGHTDDQLPPETSQQLSEARALAVKAFLVANGVPGSRLETAGWGQSRPIAENDTAEGRHKNRRIEIVNLGPSR